MTPGVRSTEFWGSISTVLLAGWSGVLKDPNPWVRLTALGILTSLWMLYVWKRTRLKLRNGDPS